NTFKKIGAAPHIIFGRLEVGRKRHTLDPLQDVDARLWEGCRLIRCPRLTDRPTRCRRNSGRSAHRGDGQCDRDRDQEKHSSHRRSLSSTAVEKIAHPYRPYVLVIAVALRCACPALPQLPLDCDRVVWAA